MTLTSETAAPYKQAADLILAAPRLLLVTHLKPDGDAIGSLLGLGNALRARGVTPVMVVDGGVPAYLSFIPGADQVLPAIETGDFDLMVSLDASDEERTGVAGAYGRAHSTAVLNIDHHPTNTGFGSAQLVVPEAVSTTEIVYHLLQSADQTLTPDIAAPLLAGLVTDTIGFRTNNVGPSTLEIAANLMRAGAPLYDIMTRTLNSLTYRNVELWRDALQTVVLRKGVISASVTQETLKRLHIDVPGDSGGFIGFLNSTSEARVAAVFTELDGKVELSFRAKPGYDVAQLALSLGGGGHKLASGATVAGTLDEVRERVLPLLYAVARASAT